MTTLSRTRSLARWSSLGIGVAAAAYASYAAVTWWRYGHPGRPTVESDDPLLDRFLPIADVAERHHIRVEAPADITFASACEMDVLQSPIIRAIFKTREVLLGSEPDTAVRPRGLLASTTSMGWGVLAEVPGREVVMGAVTQPWQANVTFRALPPDEFAAFNEPGYVKIAWTLRADPIGATQSIFRTETRAIATDALARTKFRRYWSFLSPGIIAIRRMMLTPVKADAERRATSDSRNHASAEDAGRHLGGRHVCGDAGSRLDRRARQPRLRGRARSLRRELCTTRGVGRRLLCVSPRREGRRPLGRHPQQADTRTMGARHHGDRLLGHQGPGRHDPGDRPLARLARLRGARGPLLARVRPTR